MACVGVVCIVAAMTPAYAQVEPDTLGFAVTPGSGPPGTVVHFEGDVPTDAVDFDLYQDPNSAYGLLAVDVPNAPEDCNLSVSMLDTHKTMTEGGHVTGSFVVGDDAGCFMSETDHGPLPAYPGEYTIALTCRGCPPIGTFTITAGSNALPRTGRDIAPLITAGIVLVAFGWAFVARGRRLRSGG